MNASAKQKAKKVKLLVLDVDGVMTQGQIVLDPQGKETKFFDVQDGFGLVLFMRQGYKTALLSARSTPAVTARAKDLGIHVVCQDASPKLPAYEKVLKKIKVDDEQVCFMADDLTDLKVLKRVGFAVAVPNAVDEVKQAADYVTTKPGGHGAVREIVELILKAQGKWSKVLNEYA